MHNVAPDVLSQRRNKCFNNFEMLHKASRDILYEDCKGCDMEHTMLWMTLEQMKLKATTRWSDTSFLALLKLLTIVLPKPNGLPSSTTYQAKKIICPLTLCIERILACPNHCILYQKEHEFKDRNKMITMRRLRMTPTKSAKKKQGRKKKNVTSDQDIEESKERKYICIFQIFLNFPWDSLPKPWIYTFEACVINFDVRWSQSKFAKVVGVCLPSH
jgi:hypothetical protein